MSYDNDNDNEISGPGELIAWVFLIGCLLAIIIYSAQDQERHQVRHVPFGDPAQMAGEGE